MDLIQAIEASQHDLKTYPLADLHRMANTFNLPITDAKDTIAQDLAIRLLAHGNRANFPGPEDDVGEYVVEELFKNKVVDPIPDQDIDDSTLEGFIKNRKIGGYFFLTVDGHSPIHESFDTVTFAGSASRWKSFLDGMLCLVQDKPMSECYESPYTVKMVEMNLKNIKDMEKFKQVLWEGLRAHYKIHLQPQAEHMYDTIVKVYQLWKSGKIRLVAMKFGYGIYDTHVLHGNNPAIVLYPVSGYEAAQEIVDVLRKEFDDSIGLARIPRGNARINDLIYVAGGNWDDKKKVVNAGVFEPDRTYYKDQKHII